MSKNKSTQKQLKTSAESYLAAINKEQGKHQAPKTKKQKTRKVVINFDYRLTIP